MPRPKSFQKYSVAMDYVVPLRLDQVVPILDLPRIAFANQEDAKVWGAELYGSRPRHPGVINAAFSIASVSPQGQGDDIVLKVVDH